MVPRLHPLSHHGRRSVGWESISTSITPFMWNEMTILCKWMNHYNICQKYGRSNGMNGICQWTRSISSLLGDCLSCHHQSHRWVFACIWFGLKAHSVHFSAIFKHEKNTGKSKGAGEDIAEEPSLGLVETYRRIIEGCHRRTVLVDLSNIDLCPGCFGRSFAILEFLSMLSSFSLTGSKIHLIHTL